MRRKGSGGGRSGGSGGRVYKQPDVWRLDILEPNTRAAIEFIRDQVKDWSATHAQAYLTFSPVWRVASRYLLSMMADGVTIDDQLGNTVLIKQVPQQAGELRRVYV